MSALRHLLIALMLAAALPAAAVDVAILDRPASEKDQRNSYAYALLRLVMERTTAEYGPYQILEAPVPMERQRLLGEMRSGRLINVTTFPINEEWRSKLRAVEIPIELGLLSWRLLLINSKNQDRLRLLATGGMLREATAGAGAGWEFRSLLEKQGFPTVTGSTYEGLFQMLRAGRFDYLPRGINEVFVEYDERRHTFPGLAIEDSILLHGRIGLVFFVAPEEARLHRRIKAGMEAMLKDGSMEKMVLEFYRRDLERARLCDRIRIDLGATGLPPAMAAQRQLWLDPFDPRHGICPARP